MKSIMHIYPSDFSSANRIEKITKTLLNNNIFDKASYIGHGKKDIKSNCEYGDLFLSGMVNGSNDVLLFKILKFLYYYMFCIYHFITSRPTCVNLHSISVAPLVLIIKPILPKTKVIYDTHELETETINSKGFRRIILRSIEKKIINMFDEVIVVSDSIASWYEEHYQLDDVEVIFNYPELDYFPDRPNLLLRNILNLNDDDLLIIYLGNLSKGRGVERLVEIFSLTSRQDMHLLFLGSGSLQEKLQSKNINNIHFHNPVSRSELLELTSGANIGIHLIEPSCLNHEYCMPNKLFEYFASMLPVIVSDVYEMSNFVTKQGIGLVVDRSWTAEETVLFLENLRGDHISKLQARVKELRRSFSWEKQEPNLLSIYERVCDG